MHGYVSSLTILNVHFLLKRIYAEQHLRVHLANILTLVRVVSMGAREINRALTGAWADFEDATQYECALTAKADYIITRNQKDFSASSIPLLSPAEFVHSYKP